MGYRKKANILKLTWDESTAHPGFEVRAKSVPLGRLMQMVKLAQRVTGDEIDPDQVNELLEPFAAALVSWNLEDEDGTPVPATLEGLYDQDLDFIIPIIMKWASAIAQVSEDLGKGSGSGVRFPEGSLPMEPLSPDPLKLIAQSYS